MSNKQKNDGGSAFPSRGGMMVYVPEEARGEIEKAVQQLDQQHAGMTLRDYFAGQALAGCAANAQLIDSIAKDAQKDGSLITDGIVDFCYATADRMIAGRAK